MLFTLLVFNLTKIHFEYQCMYTFTLYKVLQKWWCIKKSIKWKWKAIERRTVKTSKFSVTQTLKFSWKIFQSLALVNKKNLKQNINLLIKKVIKIDILSTSTMWSNNRNSLSTKLLKARASATAGMISHVVEMYSEVVCRLWRCSWSFKYPCTGKKSHGVKSGE